MKIQILDSKAALGHAAAADGAEVIRRAIQQRGTANIIVATGASQFETLGHLIAETDIDWTLVTGFHLDEYLDLSEQHPASFRRYLRERFVAHLPLREFYYVNGEAADPVAECQRLGAILQQHPIDAAFVGIGENGHLAFNDPPADFETHEPYLVVNLDEACRQQQFGEGWFDSLDAVPRQAISMSVQQILKSEFIFCSVPDERKAWAVEQTVTAEISPQIPASLLRTHPHTILYLDAPSASLLKPSVLQAGSC